MARYVSLLAEALFLANTRKRTSASREALCLTPRLTLRVENRGKYRLDRQKRRLKKFKNRLEVIVV